MTHTGQIESRQQETSHESESKTGSKEEETEMLESDSVLLANVLNILEKVEQELHRHHHHHDGHHHEHHHHEHHIPPPKDEQPDTKEEEQDQVPGEALTESESECGSFSSSESDEREEVLFI